ncbi:SDR family oxidoreductase [Nocardioides seonyuensis]|uniref:SDR family oxidoreductase n=1 Tax=Nocardioides seonyuensis TaxID=2518371 RepID=A0A4P7IFF3_9ACTN|nr:SDR family oxidoreductase [Nocardioides seonyuensis]QBX55908.1 SDR family oxidoreductase [Nocardioides seonyuensis]
MSALSGCVALVTGATSGIGRAVAVELAGQGAHVAVTGRREDRLASLAAEIGQDRVHAIPADLTSAAAATAVVSDVVARFGRLDVVVNAAGVMLNGPTAKADMGEWEAMVDLNLKALLYVTKHALPHLVAAVDSPRGVADLVNISSIAGRFANRNVAVYNATKFGVTAASESWRQEYAPMGVRVSVVEPGVVDTELFGHQQSAVQEHYERLFDGVERLRASDIAEVVAFIVTAPRRMAVAEVVVRPTDQV